MINSLSPGLQRAVARSCWLAELAATISEADRMTRALCDARSDREGLADAILLRRHLHALGQEVEALRRAREPDRGNYVRNGGN